MRDNLQIDKSGPIKHQKGQGIVEYILLLVVVIAIGYAVLNRLFVPVQQWTEFYIGQYISCLLDQGELPGLGGENDVQDCDYQSMIAGDTDGNTAENSQDGEGDQNNQQNQNNQNQQDALNRNQARGQNLTQNRQGRMRTNSFGVDGPGGPASRRIDLGEVAGPGELEDGESSGRVSVAGSSNLQRRQQRIRRIRGLSGQMVEQEIAQRRRATAPVPVAKIDEDTAAQAGIGNRQKKFRFDPDKPLRKPANDDFGTWSFGRFFRMFLIIIVITAIVWFVGLQVAQITRSMEK